MTSNPTSVQNNQCSSLYFPAIGSEKSQTEVSAAKSLPKAPEHQQRDHLLAPLWVLGLKTTKTVLKKSVRMATSQA
jgi:hypothetical protein